MTNIIDRQTFVLSFNLSYSPGAVNDIPDMVQIWCNKTNDNLIASFPNNLGQSYNHDEHFRLNNSLQNESIAITFQTTANGAPSFSNPQNLISPLETQKVLYHIIKQWRVCCGRTIYVDILRSFTI